MEWIIRARRQLRIVSEDLSDTKNTRWRSTIPLFFSEPSFVLTGEADAPGEAILAEQNRNRRPLRAPFPSATSLKQSHLALLRIPIRRSGYQQLGAIVWNTGGVRTAHDEDGHE
jgi:hypothetical protein